MKKGKVPASSFGVKIAALLFCILGCKANATESTNGPASEQAVAGANNSFGLHLLTQIAMNNPGSNIFISPYSASTALQMVSEGAAGTTQKQMQEVLGTFDLPQSALDEGSQEIGALIDSKNTNFTLITANALWYQHGVSIKPAFIEANQLFFGASVEAVNFYTPTAADSINSWASNATAGNIADVVSYPFHPVPSLLLANAVYFKGSWQNAFATNLTLPAPFQVNGSQVTVPMMNQTGTFLYTATNGYQAIQLPYQGGDLAMYVFLPNMNSSVSSVLGTIDRLGWQQVSQDGFSDQQGSLSLPKFNLDYSVNLIPPLEVLGMKNAFSSVPGVADFRNISTTSQLHISSANQQAVIKVDETGTEAAAVTTIGATALAISDFPTPPFTMIVNRPFLFFIEDQQTGTILFMGIVSNP